MTFTSKGKATHDWRRPAREDTSPSAMANLRLPFKVFPEAKDTVPEDLRGNARHYVSGQDDVPYTGYYIRYKTARISVTNAYGVWFECRPREGGYEAFRLARKELRLPNDPLEGIDMDALERSGEPLGASRPPSRVQSIPENHDTMPPSPPSFGEPTRIGSSQTARGSPRRARGIGDDPFTSADIEEEDDRDKNDDYLRLELEGTPPKPFTGDRTEAVFFLSNFKQFMTMNHGSRIAKDPYMKCSYFLSLIDGPTTKGWVAKQKDWLKCIKNNDDELPFGMDAWQVMRNKFKIKYANRERAYDELSGLKMKGGNLDEYIADYQRLGEEAGIHFDDVSNLWMFARGLPRALCDDVLSHDNPDTFDEWTKAAQKRQRIHMKMKAIYTDCGTPPSNSNQSQGQQRGWAWRRSDNANSNWCANAGQRSGQGRPNSPRARLPPRDDGRMDTSAAIGKATSDKEKEEYRKEGRCFECGRQGHLARDCQTKKSRQQQGRARATRTEDEKAETTNLIELDDATTDTSETWALAVRVTHLSKEERNAFIDEMRRLGEDFGFQDA